MLSRIGFRVCRDLKLEIPSPLALFYSRWRVVYEADSFRVTLLHLEAVKGLTSLSLA
jgi:hypothetical protein